MKLNKSEVKSHHSSIIPKFNPRQGHISSSIPTKSTVLIKPVVKSKGFGHSAERFDIRPVIESGAMPGPGKYTPQIPNTWGQSIGGKIPPKRKIIGGGGFKGISSFGTGYVKGGPGPGAYNITSIFDDKSDFSIGDSKPRRRSNFGLSGRSQSLSSLQHSEMDKLRGPGEYEIKFKPQSTNPGVSMRSQSKRFEGPHSDTNNLDYYIADSNFVKKKPYAELNYSSAFALPKNQRKVRLHQHEMIKKVVAELKPGVKAPQQEIFGKEPILGPGQYEVQQSYLFSKEYNVKGVVHSFPSFVSKNPRIPIKKAQEIPDPTTYNLPSCFDSQKFLVKSPVFMSESAKGDYRQVEGNDASMAYDPVMKPSKKYFHKNPGSKTIWH